MQVWRKSFLPEFEDVLLVCSIVERAGTTLIQNPLYMSVFSSLEALKIIPWKLLYNSGSSTCYSVTTWRGGEAVMGCRREVQEVGEHIYTYS